MSTNTVQTLLPVVPHFEPAESKRSMLVRQLRNEVMTAMKTIKPQQRIQVVLPRTLSHDKNGEKDWDLIEEVQLFIRGYNLGPHTFACLRFDRDESSDVTVDVCCLPEHVEIPISLVCL